MRATLIAFALAGLNTPAISSAAERGVPPGYQQVAAEYAIPAQIFYAIALAESGKLLGRSTELHPWPWTLNIHGESHFYRERRAAEQALRGALARGEDRVDIGLMQVNWRFHQARFSVPRNALDPYRNLRIAAQILCECHRDQRDWWRAVGCYHAPADRVRAAQYQAVVRQHWRQIRGTG